jgi:hypothetical protein
MQLNASYFHFKYEYIYIYDYYEHKRKNVCSYINDYFPYS